MVSSKLAEVRVSKLVLNVVAGLLTVPLCVVGIVLAHLLPHHIEVAPWHLAALLVAIILVIPVHEALHGLGLRLFSRVSRREMRFGLFPGSLIFYCHCSVPISIAAYRRMALLPLWTMGGIMLVALVVFPADWVGLLAGVVWAASTGDVWIVAKLRRFPQEVLVQDASGEIGCDVLAAEPAP